MNSDVGVLQVVAQPKMIQFWSKDRRGFLQARSKHDEYFHPDPSVLINDSKIKLFNIFRSFSRTILTNMQKAEILFPVQGSTQASQDHLRSRDRRAALILD